MIRQNAQHSKLHKDFLCIQPDLRVSSHILHVKAYTFSKCNTIQRCMWIPQNIVQCFHFHPCGSTSSSLFSHWQPSKFSSKIFRKNFKLLFSWFISNKFCKLIWLTIFFHLVELCLLKYHVCGLGHIFCIKEME